MDPPTLDVAGVTTMAETHAHLAAFTYALEVIRAHTYVWWRVYHRRPQALHPPTSWNIHRGGDENSRSTNGTYTAGHYLQ